MNEKDEKDNKNNEILNTIFNEMIYDLENFMSFKLNCDKDENNIYAIETYLPKTLRYFV